MLPPKAFNPATVIASPTQEGEAIPFNHCKRSIIFFNPFRVVHMGGLPAMGYDFVSPMAIGIQGLQPCFVANLRFVVTP
jgi:hypothetical protein